jgi:hypothetical protein
LQDQLEEAEAARSDLEARVSRITSERDQLETKLDRAHVQRVAEQELLERVRKALAIGLGLLEDHKQGAVENVAGNGRKA